MKHKILLVLTLLSTHVMSLLGQEDCNFSISLPSDITICEPGYVNLNGSISGNYLGFNWTGTDGFYDDANLNPRVYVDKTTTYKLKAFGEPTGNLIFNGDFSSGNTGFTSDYLYVADISGYTEELWPEGTYSVTSNPSFVHTYFSNCSDHTGGGNMMVVNGSPTYSRIWCQTITVTPNTTYIFQAFAASVESSSPAILQFSANGALLGSPFNLTSQTCRWDEFYEIWDSGTATSVEICITNQNLAYSGNDFAIDDIYFGALCQKEEEFTVTLSEFNLAPPIPQYINCSNPDAILTVTPIPANNNYTYSWYTQNGSIISNTTLPDILVNAGGTYFVTVTDDVGCTKVEVYDVYDDFEKPNLLIEGNPLLSCTDKSTQLTIHSISYIYDIFWTFPDQSIHTEKTIMATAPGIYTVEVTGDNGCINATTIEVSYESSQFDYDSKKSGPLTCSIPNVDIYLDVFSQVDSILWHSPGIIYQNEGRDTITVQKAGYYVFELFLGDDCSIKDSVKVDLLPPLIAYKIPETDTITCLLTTIDLALDSLDGVRDISWFPSGADPIHEDTLAVNKSGYYHFTLTDINGCTVSDSILVHDDLALPQYTVDIDPIDCKTNTGSFHVRGLHPYDYFWLGSTDTSTSEDPIFGEEGDYTLIVTGPNGCKDTTQYFLPSSKDFPAINGTISPITCTNPQGSIDLGASIPAALTWTGPNGTTGTGNQITSATPGLFVVVAETDEGCISQETFEMPIDTIKPLLAPIQDFILTCANDHYTPSLDLNTYETYQWQGPGLNATSPLNIDIYQPGNYSLTLINANGCAIQRSFVVTENKQKPTFTILAETLNCKSPETQLVISGDPLLFLILNGKDTIPSNFIINMPGTYTFTGVNDLGCSNDFILTVNGAFNNPQIALEPVVLNCYHPEVWLKNSGPYDNLLFTWNTPSGTINSDSILITSTQPISLTATNEDGCSSTVTATITSDFDKPTLHVEGNPVIKCNEESTTLTGIAPGQIRYLWTNASGKILGFNPILLVNAPGDYFLQGLNEINGCTDMLNISISKEPTPNQVLYTEQQPLCFGESGQFVWTNGVGGTAPYTLLLNNKSINPNERISINSGTYHIVLSDANGCQLKDTFDIDQLFDFAVDAGRDTVINLGNSYLLRPNSTLPLDEISGIIWEPSQTLSCADCFNPIATPEQDTRYTITIYDANGCTKQDHVIVRVQFIKGYLAPNIFNPISYSGNSKFTIFPLENSIRIIKNLSIYDRWGNLMFIVDNIEAGNPELGWDGKFLGRDVQAGVYVWKAEIEYKDSSLETAAGDITIFK
ncbi:MAG: gliding motility-associated C-terminal domain-containing protein [Chitinophagales bacterium]|nr:gliding motility-associated C-terminal domain-containing protein [Chitinophagales bacterium]